MFSLIFQSSNSSNASADNLSVICGYSLNGHLLYGSNSCSTVGAPTMLSQANQLSSDVKEYLLHTDEEYYSLILNHHQCIHCSLDVSKLCNYDQNGNLIPSFTVGQKKVLLDLQANFSFPICPFMTKSIVMVQPNTVEINGTFHEDPLKQFKARVNANDVKCEEYLKLIIKAEDGTPACVSYDTATKLLDRGWAKEIVSLTPENATIPASFMPCDAPYAPSNTGLAVLYMATNSTGKICVQYSNSNPPQSTGIRIFEVHHIKENAQDVSIIASSNTIPTGNSTVIYTVKTGNHAGFYGLTIFCVGMPFVVGYDSNSTLVESDFPWLSGTYYCPAQLYEYQIVGLTGIGVKYIQ